MFHLVSIVIAAELILLHWVSEANGHLNLNRKFEMDNNIPTNFPAAAAAHPKRRRLSQYVYIASAPPKIARAYLGEPLQLECEVHGSPTPSVVWLKNGQVVVDYEEDANEIFPSLPSSLGQLTSKLVVTMPRNGDIYTCLASAGGVKQQATSTTIFTDGKGDLLAIENFLRVSPKPVITLYYKALFQEIGTNAILPCRVHSMTKAQVYWTDNYDNVVYGDSRIRLLPSGDLMITGLQWEDMGQFTCTVKNAFGKQSAETFLYPTKI